MTTVRNRLFAAWFARFGARNEKRGNARLRAELLAGLAGPVLEVGAGTGLNFAHYPSTVDSLLAVEPEPELRAHAETAAGSAPVPVVVRDGTADALPVADGAVRVVVVSGVLCSVPDPAAALAEFRRVLAPGGQLRFYEHVRGRGARGRVQRLGSGVHARLMGGCRPDRDTLAAITAAGFRVHGLREFVFPPGAWFSLVGPRIHGVALRD